MSFGERFDSEAGCQGHIGHRDLSVAYHLSLWLCLSPRLGRMSKSILVDLKPDWEIRGTVLNSNLLGLNSAKLALLLLSRFK